MFDDFEDPFALPMEELELAAPPRATVAKKRGPAYSADEVMALAGYGKSAGALQDPAYALRARQRIEVLNATLGQKRSELEAAVRVCDDELQSLGAKLVESGAVFSMADDQGPVLEALRSGEAGAILAAPALGAFAQARTVSRDTALAAAALNALDDGAYRRGAELIALSAVLMLVGIALLLLL